MNHTQMEKNRRQPTGIEEEGRAIVWHGPCGRTGVGWSGLTGEEGQEALRAGVDDVDLMQGHRVHHLLAFLELPVWALYELRLWGEGGVGSWGVG